MTDTNIEVLQRISDGYFPHGAEQRAALGAAITALSARASAGEGGEWVMGGRAHGPIGGDWYVSESGSVCVDWDADPAHQLSLILKRDGSVAFSALVGGRNFVGNAMTVGFILALREFAAAPQPAQAGASSGDRPSDNALMGPDAPPHARLLLHMKHGPRVHGMACDDPAFKARHDAAIDAAVDAMLAAAPQPQEAPAQEEGDWRIDHSAGCPILVYKDCSVIESEQAEYVLRLIAADNAPPAHGDGEGRDAGPWVLGSDGDCTIYSEDFTHDVELSISGDFADVDERRSYAEWLCTHLNGTRAATAGAVVACADLWHAIDQARDPSDFLARTIALLQGRGVTRPTPLAINPAEIYSKPIEAETRPTPEAQEARDAWTPVSERLPDEGTECLVLVQYGTDPKFYVAIDTWRMQREAPVSFSSATIETGLMWDENDFLDVLMWQPIKRPSQSAIDAALALPAQGES